jgi:DNA-binding NtrC family response regulator/tetratricopeptide (TPR) repeat protein
LLRTTEQCAILGAVVEPLSELIGHSASIVAVREQVGRLLRTWSGARRPPPVLIQGETGTGKGLLARAIHRASPRASAPFVDINCAAVPETLLEAELFGYERGAFTDAKQSKPGLFLLAHRGTLFLDEVALMPPPLQAKLLSVLEERAVRRLGGTRAEPVDVWVIAATNEDLAQALRARRFRDDLYHRLAVVSLSLPPLRARGEDIVLLAEHFLAGACRDYGLGGKTFTSDARGALVSYPWPGNIRELSNVIERAALLADTMTLDATHLALAPDAPGPSAPASEETSGAGAGTTMPLARSSRDAMQEHLERVLAQTGWNISRTAALLGVSRNTVMARIARFGLRGPRKAGGAAVSPPVDAVNVERAPVAPPRAAPSPGPAHWERRRLTFVRVLFPARADDEVEPSVARHLEVAADKFRAFGARVEGGGPSLLLAVFGLDERDEPAVLAGHGALVVRNAARHGAEDGDAPALRIGLHTVELFVRAGTAAPTIDADGSREAWNAVAEAMKVGSPGSIVATASAAALLRRRFALVPLGPAAAAYRVDGLGRTDVIASAPRTLFVGRREELALLQSRLAAAIEGRGQVVNLVADAGMGKSRLVLELAAGVHLGRARYVEGRCLPSEVQTPFAPLLQILRTFAGVTESDASDAIRAKVAAALSQRGVDDADVLGDLVRLLDATVAAPPSSVGPGARPRLFAAIRRMLAAEAARAPLLLIVEDLHWIDPSSEECLSTLVDAIHDLRILLIASHRPDYRAPWASSSHVVALALSPLSDEESLAVIRAVVPAGAGSAAAEAGITGRAEGNPLFLEELSRGVVEVRDVRLPATVDDAISGRLARLGPRPRRVMSVLAVIGRDATAALARTVLELSDDVLQSTVEQLRRADFLHETSVDGEPGFTFRHALVQEATYARVPAAERRALHVRVLDAMERLYPDRDVEHVERLVHHAVRGEVWDQAVAYLRQAGVKALTRAAYREAKDCFEQALVALAHLSESRETREHAIDARFELRAALIALGEFERIVGCLRDAEDLAQVLGDQRRLGQVSVYLCHILFITGHPVEALGIGERARSIAESLGDVPLRVTGMQALGAACLELGDYRKAEALFRTMLPLIDSDHSRDRFGGSGFPTVMARAFLAWILGDLGSFAEGTVRGEEAIRLAESLDDPYSLAFASWAFASLRIAKGDLRDAEGLLRRGLAVTHEWNMPYFSAIHSGNLGYVYALQGRPGEGIPLLEHALSVMEGMRGRFALSLYLALLSEAYVLADPRGRIEDALTAARRAVTLAREGGQRNAEARALRILGDAVARGDSPEDAECHYRDAHALADELGMRPLVAHCHLAMGTMYARVGKRREAHERLAAATAMYREMDMRFWSERAEAAVTD